MNEQRLDRIADALFPEAKKQVAGASLGVLEGTAGVTINGQGYASAPRVSGGRPAAGMTAITMPIAGSSQRAVIAYGGYYAPQTTPTVEEP